MKILDILLLTPHHLQNNDYGPYIYGNDSLLIKNSTINDNSDDGLSVSETITNIQNTTFHGNNRAIQFYSQTNDSLELNNVVLDSNSYYGLWVGSSNNDQIKVIISNSTFSNNSTSPPHKPRLSNLEQEEQIRGYKHKFH